jgi:membrane protease subunit (stomatin/prohibitin family)
MNLDEQAINAVKEYFESIAQNAIDVTYEAIGSETTFAEFMEAVNQKINQFSSEIVASEVLHLSAKTIENFNAGEGMDVDDVQVLLESKDDLDIDEDEDE